MSELPTAARPNYFDGEALLTADFVCEQRYHMDMLAALNRGLHIWGIAQGLEVYWQQAVQSRQVRVAAGMAIDRLGREIILADPQVVVLSDAEAGSLYYLTISYAEAYADLTDQTGVAGYKRIVQQPKLAYARSLPDPGLNVLLAVVSLSSQAVVNALTYRAGAYERRNVGGRFGQVDLVIPGTGIGSGNASPDAVTLGAQLEAAGAFLAIDAGRSRLNGVLSVKGNLGIGIEHPDGNLQVLSPVFDGPGTCTSNGTALFLSEPVTPPLRPGDTVMPQIAVGTTPPNPGWGVIAAATDDPKRYVLERPFTPDLTLPHTHTYLRGVVAQIAAPVGDPPSSPRDLLRIDRDGTVSLGMPAMPDSGVGVGAAALRITSDRRVGIGLAGAPQSNARLEVDGDIKASALSVAGQILAQGTVKAQSFEGNGSKLQNLPILSYWTKIDPTSDNSSIYYARGSVCVQTTEPFGALTVGTGKAFVGNGLITASATSANTAIGNQTRFRDQVNAGDTIVVGTLRALRETVSRVVSDTELILEAQFPVLLLQTDYKIVATGKSGSGLISSNGTRILGTVTTFTTDFRPGDVLEIEDFVPNPGETRTDRALAAGSAESITAEREADGGVASDGAVGWMVGKVVSDTELTLIAPAGASTFPANLSAFMVRPSLMAYLRDSSPISGETLNTPALLVVSNAVHPEGAGGPPNTVAINYELDAIDPAYALMVDGPTNFSGGGHFDRLSVVDLTVSDKAMVGGTLDPASSYRLQVTGGDLRVDQSVSVGASVSAQAVSATGTVSAAVVSTTGDVSATGSLKGSALTAAGVNVFADGTVSLFGSIDGDTLGPKPVTFTANTDGFVSAQIQTNPKAPYLDLICKAGNRNLTTSAGTIVVPDGKDKIKLISQTNSMMMPVKRGELVELTLLGVGENQTAGQYQWIPLGPPRPGDASADLAAPEPLPPLGGDAVRPRLMRVTTPEQIPNLVRLFTDALTTVAGKSVPDDLVRSMREGVLGLTCVGRPAGASPEPGSIDAVIENGMRLLGTTLTGEQKAQLAKSTAGLIDAPYLEARTRVEQFLDDLQQVLGTTLSDGDRRKLLVTLMRVVGVDDDPGQP